MPYSKPLGFKLYELRTTGKVNIRIFYSFRDSKVILLHAFIKKTQKTPRTEINLAKKELSSLDI